MYGSICPRRRYPTLQTHLMRPAIQAYRDTSYEEIARYTLDDVTKESIEFFRKRLRSKLDQMKAIIGAMRRILDWSPYYPYRYRDEAALSAFQEWRASLENFTSVEGLERIEHLNECKNRYCVKLQCMFHETNAEKSLLIYPFDFDVVRNPRTGRLVDVAVLVGRAKY